MIADAFEFLDGYGMPALVKSDIPSVEIEYLDGVNLTKTSLVSSMILDILPSKELSNVSIVVMFQPIDRFEEILQLTKLLNQTSNYTILLYNEMSDNTLENLLFALSQGKSKIIPVSIHNYGKDMTNIMEEISIYTNAGIIDGTKCKSTDISAIKVGHVDSVVLSLSSLMLKKENSGEYDYKYISKKACIIKVGGANKVVLEDNYKRIEDAVYSVAGAIEHGVMFGGYGCPYSFLAQELDEEITPKYIIDALKHINRKIFNGQQDGNALDSALVISEVIKNAFIMAAQVSTTNAIIYDSIHYNT